MTDLNWRNIIVVCSWYWYNLVHVIEIYALFTWFLACQISDRQCQKAGVVFVLDKLNKNLNHTQIIILFEQDIILSNTHKSSFCVNKLQTWQAQGSAKKMSPNRGSYLPKKYKHPPRLKINSTSSPAKFQEARKHGKLRRHVLEMCSWPS